MIFTNSNHILVFINRWKIHYVLCSTRLGSSLKDFCWDFELMVGCFLSNTGDIAINYSFFKKSISFQNDECNFGNCQLTSHNILGFWKTSTVSMKKIYSNKIAKRKITSDNVASFFGSNGANEKYSQTSRKRPPQIQRFSGRLRASDYVR